MKDERGALSMETACEFNERRRQAVQMLGKLIHTARIAKGWSQERVALEAGVSVMTYSTLERGFAKNGELANPTPDTIVRVMGVLKISAVLSTTIMGDIETSVPVRVL